MHRIVTTNSDCIILVSLREKPDVLRGTSFGLIDGNW